MPSYQKSTWIHTRAYPALDLSWSESKVKSPGPNTELDSLQNAYGLSNLHPGDSFECQHQTSYSNSLKREDLIIS